MQPPGHRQLATLWVLAAACLFGTTGTVLQKGPDSADALGVGAVRLLIGGATLCVLAAIDRPATRRSWRPQIRSVVAGGVAVAMYQLCFFVGTTRAGVALATVLTIGSGPVFSGLIDWRLHRRPPSRRWAAGTAISIVGVGLLGVIGGAREADAVGVIAALASGLGWAIYATIGKHQIERGLDSTATMAAMFSAAGIIVSPLLFTQHIGWTTTRAGAAMAGYLGVITVGIAYTLYGRGLRHLAAPTVITLTLAEPITATVLSVVVLRESIAVLGWIGIVAVLVGLFVTARSEVGSGPSHTEVATTVAL